MTKTASRPTITRLDRQYRASAAIVGLSRGVIADQAEAWGLAPAMKDALVRSVSELVTNACGVSSALDLIKIRLEWFPTCVLLSVYDISPQQPKSSAHDLTLEELDALPDDDPLTLPKFGGWGLCATRRSAISLAQRGEIGGTSLDLMAYLDPKGEGDNSMPGNQRSRPGVRSEVLGDPRDMATA